ncbi:MAG: DUF3488 and transglutaminase-like domain-containing protein [Jatrophihabitans sp.]
MTTATASRRVSSTASERLTAKRTGFALLASALGAFPLKALFSDYAWLLDAWLTMAIVIAPAALIRLRRAPGALDIWPGVVLLIPWLTARFMSGHATFGFLPTSDTWHQISLLMTDLHKTTRDETAPIHTTIAVRLVICALLGLLAALVDLIAVVGRRGALAGVPLLLIFTVAGAVPRKPVSWAWFALAAIGYLILLALDARDDLDHWGRRVTATGKSASGAGRARTTLSLSAPRIAAAAVVAAVLLPVLVPGDSRNLLANAFHNGSGNGVGGFGGSGGGKISPFAALKGQLNRSNPIALADVHMLSGSRTQPFYLKVNVLSDYGKSGWGVAAHGDTTNIADQQFPTSGGNSFTTTSLAARVSITKMRGNPPVFDRPVSIDGLPANTTWSSQDQLLLGSQVTEGTTFTERFAQPTPTRDQLDIVSDGIDPSVRDELKVPSDLPVFVRNLVRDTIKGATGPYEKARKLSDFFASANNQFTYDLKTTDGDSGSDLVDFLQNRRGYCQQYAAAMAIMLRTAGVPARVVLGYTHNAPNKSGDFAITTANAHSWVEAWFNGIGWLPFDPTPSDGQGGGGRDQLAYAPKTVRAADGGPGASINSSTSNTARAPTAPSARASVAPRADTSAGSGSWTPWLLLGALVILALMFVPAAVRARRRHARYAAVRRDGDPDPLWAELSDTAVDLGYVWSPSRSPRQTAAWLAEDAGGSAGSLSSLAVAIEKRRFANASAPPTTGVDRLVRDLRDVTGQLRSRQPRSARLRAALLPASLGWTPRRRGGRRRL